MENPGSADNGRPQCWPSVDALQAVLFHLMTQYSCTRCPLLAQITYQHLHLLLEHPHIELLPRQREVLAKLLCVWQSRLPVNGDVAAAVIH